MLLSVQFISYTRFVTLQAAAHFPRALLAVCVSSHKGPDSVPAFLTASVFIIALTFSTALICCDKAQLCLLQGCSHLLLALLVQHYSSYSWRTAGPPLGRSLTPGVLVTFEVITGEGSQMSARERPRNSANGNTKTLNTSIAQSACTCMGWR